MRGRRHRDRLRYQNRPHVYGLDAPFRGRPDGLKAVTLAAAGMGAPILHRVMCFEKVLDSKVDSRCPSPIDRASKDCVLFGIYPLVASSVGFRK